MQTLASLALTGMDWRAFAHSRDPVEQLLTVAVLDVVAARIKADSE